MDSMHNVSLIGAEAGWGLASGLNGVLERLGFTPRSDISTMAVSVLPQLIIVQWPADDKGAALAMDWDAIPADRIRFVVVPADIPEATRAVLGKLFHGVLTAPVDELALCKALGAQRYIALTATERRSLRAKVDELACGDEATGAYLLRLIIDTNRTGLATLCESDRREAWDEVRSAAHRIAGSARMLDCGGLTALLKRLETAARDRQVELVKALMPLAVNTLESLEMSVRTSLGVIQ
jgi:HPt (histidine-containing phosphotransfer) domain-containing protein